MRFDLFECTDARTSRTITPVNTKHDTERCVRLLPVAARGNEIYLNILEEKLEKSAVRFDPFRMLLSQRLWRYIPSNLISLFFAVKCELWLVTGSGLGCEMHSDKLSNCINIFSRAPCASHRYFAELRWQNCIHLFWSSSSALYAPWSPLWALAHFSFHLPRFTAFIAFSVRFEPCLSFQPNVPGQIDSIYIHWRRTTETGIVFHFYVCVFYLRLLSGACSLARAFVTWYSSTDTYALCIHSAYPSWRMRHEYMMYDHKMHSLYVRTALECELRDEKWNKIIIIIVRTSKRASEHAVALIIIKLNEERCGREWERDTDRASEKENRNTVSSRHVP